MLPDYIYIHIHVHCTMYIHLQNGGSIFNFYRRIPAGGVIHFCAENDKWKSAPVKRWTNRQFFFILLSCHNISRQRSTPYKKLSYTEQGTLYTKTSCCFTACMHNIIFFMVKIFVLHIKYYEFDGFNTISIGKQTNTNKKYVTKRTRRVHISDASFFTLTH